MWVWSKKRVKYESRSPLGRRESAILDTQSGSEPSRRAVGAAAERAIVNEVIRNPSTDLPLLHTTRMGSGWVPDGFRAGSSLRCLKIIHLLRNKEGSRTVIIESNIYVLKHSVQIFCPVTFCFERNSMRIVLRKAKLFIYGILDCWGSGPNGCKVSELKHMCHCQKMCWQCYEQPLR